MQVNKFQSVIAPDINNSIGVESSLKNNIQIQLLKSKVASRLSDHILSKFKKKVDIKDFKILKKLGQGAYGKVYLVDHKDK